MHRFKWLYVTGLCLSTAFAEPISIGGVVKDKDTNTPLKGVQVRLKTLGTSATSDASGVYLLTGTTSIGRASGAVSNPALLADGAISFVLDQDSRVSIQTFSTRGERVASIDRNMNAGSYRLDAPAIGPGTYFHRIRIADRAPVVLTRNRYSQLSAGSAPNTAGAIAGRALAVTFQDTVVASLAGYADAKVAVSSATVSNLEILLAKDSPTGTLTKARVINTTDLQADPDDEESLVHMLVTSNEVDIEGLIVVTSCWKKSQSGTSYIDKFLNAYEQSYSNLKVHASDFPTPAALKSVVALGQKGYSMGDVGTGKDSPGSDLIIAAVDKDDPRPVWVNLWGGGNTLAQAITKVKATRSQAELDKFLSKLRVFDILGQDEAGAWMTKTYPNLFYIRATGVYGWQYSASWVASNVQNKGALGGVYPTAKYAIEGDTPAFLHQLAIGLNDPDKIDQGGWGGRFDIAKKTNIASMSAVTGEGSYKPYMMYGNTSEGANAIKKWSDGYTNDFAARMIWSTTSSYAGANHHPIAVINSDKTRNVLYITAKAGSDVVLDGAGSSDPDKNSLTWSWTQYNEPSTGTSTISAGATSKATVKAPAAGKTAHIVLILKDNGSPALTAYRRVVITGS